jgi:membrane protease YdiL (CAAX protease family)
MQPPVLQETAVASGPVETPPAPEAVPRPRAHGLNDFAVGVAVIWALNAFLGVPVAVALHAIGRGDLADRVAGYWLPVAAVITLSVSWWLACRKYRLPVREGLGLARRRPTPLLLSGLGGVAAALMYGLFVRAGIGTEKTPMQEWLSSVAIAPGGGVIMLVVAIFVAGVEEIYYRGFAYPALARRWGAGVATALVASWFGLVHVPQLWGNPIAMAYVASVGLGLTLLRRFSGSTLPGLVAHMAYNGSLSLPAALLSLARLLRGH